MLKHAFLLYLLLTAGLAYPQLIFFVSNGFSTCLRVDFQNQITESEECARNVNTSLSYATIQQAVDAPETSDGHTIIICRGIHHENVVLNKTLKIIGEDKRLTVIDANFSGSPFYISADNAVIQNLTVKNSGKYFPSSGIFVDADSISVLDSIVTDCASGIYFYHSNSSNVYGTEVNQCIFGLWLDHASLNNKVVGCNVSLNSQYGMYAGVFSDDNVFTFNNVSSNLCGLGFSNASNNIVFNNNFMENSVQATCYSSINNWTYGNEGNFWKNHNLTDDDHDGVCNEPFFVNDDNVDTFPFAGPIYRFQETHSGRFVTVVSDLEIKEFDYLPPNNSIRLLVSGSSQNQSYGFCRLCIPHSLLEPDNLSIIIDSGETTVLNQNTLVHDNGTYRWIYFAFLFNEAETPHEILIIPEISSFMIYCIILACISIIILLSVSIIQRNGKLRNHTPATHVEGEK
jgi:hypothetical protein